MPLVDGFNVFFIECEFFRFQVIVAQSVYNAESFVFRDACRG